jgi:hypothetical protein
MTELSGNTCKLSHLEDDGRAKTGAGKTTLELQKRRSGHPNVGNDELKSLSGVREQGRPRSVGLEDPIQRRVRTMLNGWLVLAIHARDTDAGCRVVLSARSRQFIVNDARELFLGLGA